MSEIERRRKKAEDAIDYLVSYTGCHPQETYDALAELYELVQINMEVVGLMIEADEDEE
jgi:radical SAM superfamily enzyme